MLQVPTRLHKIRKIQDSSCHPTTRYIVKNVLLTLLSAVPIFSRGMCPVTELSSLSVLGRFNNLFTPILLEVRYAKRQFCGKLV